VLLRFNFLLREIYFLISLVSLSTMVLAGIRAVFELDFKKVVAISTLSQLGFMIYCISSGFWLISILHIIFHAFFKSCLFLSTGSLIHFFFGDQDSRNFGSLGLSFFSKLYFTIRVLRLAGFPFSLGFYSKDSVLSLVSYSRVGGFSFLFFVGCCFTVSYRVRLVYMAFFRFSTFPVLPMFYEDFCFFSLFLLFFFLLFYWVIFSFSFFYLQ